jgi:hypothetical protein
MGDAEGVVISIADIYREVVGMRSDVQGLVIQVGALRDDTKDHETRLRRVESDMKDCVTEDDMEARTAHSLRLAGVISGVISAVGAVIGVVIGLH